MKTSEKQFSAERSPHKRHEDLCSEFLVKRGLHAKLYKLPLILILFPNNKTKTPTPKSRGQSLSKYLAFIVQTKHLPKSDMILTLLAGHKHEYSQLVHLLVFLPVLLQAFS